MAFLTAPATGSPASTRLSLQAWSGQQQLPDFSWRRKYPLRPVYPPLCASCIYPVVLASSHCTRPTSHEHVVPMRTRMNHSDAAAPLHPRLRQRLLNSKCPFPGATVDPINRRGGAAKQRAASAPEWRPAPDPPGSPLPVQPNSLTAVFATSSPWCLAPSSSFWLGWRCPCPPAIVLAP